METFERITLRCQSKLGQEASLHHTGELLTTPKGLKDVLTLESAIKRLKSYLSNLQKINKISND